MHPCMCYILYFADLETKSLQTRTVSDLWGWSRTIGKTEGTQRFQVHRGAQNLKLFKKNYPPQAHYDVQNAHGGCRCYSRRPCQISPCRVSPCRVSPCPVLPCPVLPCPVSSINLTITVNDKFVRPNNNKVQTPPGGGGGGWWLLIPPLIWLLQTPL